MIQKIKNFLFTRRFAKNLVLLVAIYGVLIFSLVFLLGTCTNHGEKLEVPNLVNKNFKLAGGLIDAEDFTLEVLDSIYDPTKVEGTIVSQDPAPTSLSKIYVKSGRTIYVRVTKKSRNVEMPQCVDKSQRFAETILANRGIKYKIEYKETSEANGAVLEQYYQGKLIAEKTKIPIGSTVKIVVGRNLGGVPIPIPDLVGLTIFEAKARLTALGNINFLAVCEGCVTTADSSAALIQSQSPAFEEGAMMATGTTMTVYAGRELME